MRKQTLELFERINQRAAALLSCVDSTGITTCMSEEGEQIFFDERKKKPYHLHSTAGARKEANQWFSTVAVNGINTLLIFGIGSGWHIIPILEWLHESPERRCIILEDDLALLSSFLDSSLAKVLVHDPQVLLLFYEEGLEGDKLFEKLAWSLYQRTFSFAVLPSYAIHRPKRSAILKRRLLVEVSEVHAVLDEYMAFGIPCFKNMWRNIRFWNSAQNGHGLFNVFRDIPAIVVGAGPSLEEELKTLASLSSRCLILAGGSSLSILAETGVVPHFCAGVDPNPPQYMRLRQSQTIVRPFIFSSRLLTEALDQVLGPLLYVRGGEGYGLSSWLERASGITGSGIEGGHSVTNHLVEIAYALGCRKIALAGMDLAYTNRSLYPKLIGPALGSDESHQISESDERYILAPGASGENVLTESKWITEAAWLTRFQERHPRLHISSSSMKGLNIAGLKKESLEEFASALPPQEIYAQDLYGLVDFAVSHCPPLIDDPKRLMRAIERFKVSLSHVNNHITLMKRTLGKVPKRSEMGDHLQWQKVSHRFQAEPFYRALGSDFDKMWTKWSRCREFLNLGHRYTDSKAAIFRHEHEYLKLELFEKVARVQNILLEASVFEWMLRGVSLDGLSHFSEAAK